MTSKEVYELVEKIRTELKDDYSKLEEKSDKIYVKLETFEPVRKLVYGFVAIALTAVVTSLIALVLRK